MINVGVDTADFRTISAADIAALNRPRSGATRSFSGLSFSPPSPIAEKPSLDRLRAHEVIAP